MSERQTPAASTQDPAEPASLEPDSLEPDLLEPDLLEVEAYRDEVVEPAVDPGRSRRRRWIVMLALVGVIAGAFAWTTNRLVISPHLEPLEKADAIVVLGGPGDRYRRGTELAREGWAPLLVLSNPDGPPHTGFQPCRGQAAGVETICFDPNPGTTQGEARAIRDLVAQRGLHKIIVVATTDQVTRARMIIGRCYSGELIMAAANNPQPLLFKIAYQWAGTIKALTINRGC
jgi:hypothetical protein